MVTRSRSRRSSSWLAVSINWRADLKSQSPRALRRTSGAAQEPDRSRSRSHSALVRLRSANTASWSSPVTYFENSPVAR